MANQKNTLPEWQSRARMSPGGEATITDIENHRVSRRNRRTILLKAQGKP